MIKQTVTALLAAGALVLAGCSDTADNEIEPTSSPSETTEVESEFAQVGDTIPVDCIGNNCRGEVEIEEILLGGECKTQLFAEEIPDGMQLVQISGILTALEEVTDTSGAEIGVFAEAPVTWDSEKFKTSAEWSVGCGFPQGYEQWDGFPVKMGEKVRAYGSYWVPDDAQILGIANSRFDLADIETATPTEKATPSSETTSDSAVQQATPASQAPAPQQSTVESVPVQPEEEAVIGYTEAPGQVEPHQLDKQIASCGDPSIHETGTTFFTDGTSGWTANCAAQMM